MRVLDEQPLKAITGNEGKAFLFFCPACGNSHFFSVGARKGPSWSFDGNLVEPTFTPSLKVTAGPQDKRTCCHLNITGGKIVYHGDCTHSMAGKTIPMEDVD
jgi:hypothetical protein